MLRQVLSSSSRALRSAPRLAAGKPMLRPQFQSAMPSPLVARAAQPSVARWYSEAKEAPAEGEKDKPEAKEEAGEADALSELKKTLETKENEAKEWKVRAPCPVANNHRPGAYREEIGQVPAHRRRLPQPPGPHRARGQDGPRLCHPEVRQGPRRERR